MMAKGHPDFNLGKHLAELTKHPSLLKRCQEFYLARVIYKLPYEEIAKKYGIHLTTAWKYVQAYRKVAEEHADTPVIQDVVGFVEAEITGLLRERGKVTSAQDYATLTREIRNYQAMINEVTGIIDRRPQVSIQVNQMVTLVAELIPEVMREFGIGEDLIQQILERTGHRIQEKIPGGVADNLLTQAVAQDGTR
ncbi:MAG TPA: hypothetical protein ACFYD1_00545 [Candidatus Hypogeohydataceae bacterium YC38]|nr:hypothetical protein [Candidatus Brocadiales bacterium]